MQYAAPSELSTSLILAIGLRGDSFRALPLRRMRGLPILIFPTTVSFGCGLEDQKSPLGSLPLRHEASPLPLREIPVRESPPRYFQLWHSYQCPLLSQDV